MVQKRSGHFLEQLSSGTSLVLSASRPPAGAKGKDAAAPAVERITKTVLVRPGAGAGAAARERSVRQLSGGERRRVALALALGFADLVAARARLRCNLLVLDEVGAGHPCIATSCSDCLDRRLQPSYLLSSTL